MGMRAMMRTCIKNVYHAIEKGDKATAEAAFKQAEPAIDRMANKGLIHRNKASRHKSRLSHHIHSM